MAFGPWQVTNLVDVSLSLPSQQFSFFKIFRRQLASMVKSTVTAHALIELLERARCDFLDPGRSLSARESASLQKANELLIAPPRSRNSNRKKTREFLLDVKNCISPDVYILCATAVYPSRLGSSNLDGFVQKISRWWRRVVQPPQLTKISEKHSLRMEHMTGRPHYLKFDLFG